MFAEGDGGEAGTCYGNDCPARAAEPASCQKKTKSRSKESHSLCGEARVAARLEPVEWPLWLLDILHPSIIYCLLMRKIFNCAPSFVTL